MVYVEGLVLVLGFKQVVFDIEDGIVCVFCEFVEEDVMEVSLQVMEKKGRQ